MDSISKAELKECLLVSRHILERAATERCKFAVKTPFYSNGHGFSGHGETLDSGLRPARVAKTSRIPIEEVPHQTKTQRRQDLSDSKTRNMQEEL